MRTESLLLSALILFASSAGFAQDEEREASSKKPKRVAAEELYRPTAVPDRIVLTWTDDPARSQAVTWRTDTSVEAAFAELAVSDHGPDFVKQTSRIAAETSLLETNLGEAHYHTAVFEELEPSTLYVYRVGDGTNWSEWAQFRTASAGADPFTFVYLGDAQNLLKEHWSRVVREAYAAAPRAAFFLHAGDLVNRPDNDAEWAEWFEASGFIHRMTPCVATPGNHEYVRDALSKKLTRHWQPTFAFPRNGPEGLEETVYYFDYQGARIVSLNSNERQEAQVEWLDRVLAEKASDRWSILSFHHPIHSASRGRDNKQLRELWRPVIEKHRVDIVLQGHDHSYARSGLMEGDPAHEHVEANLVDGASLQEPRSGTVYVVSVSGPKMYPVDLEPFMRRAAENTQLFQVLTVDGNELRYEARTATGALYDAFSLRRDAQGNKTLAERIPDMPPRLVERKEPEPKKQD